jgi:hypothetical protein
MSTIQRSNIADIRDYIEMRSYGISNTIAYNYVRSLILPDGSTFGQLLYKVDNEFDFSNQPSMTNLLKAEEELLKIIVYH